MKEYRQDSHTRSVAVWAILCTATAIFLFVNGGNGVSRTARIGEVLAGVGLLIFGPASAAVYLIRARAVWVSIDPGRGIIVNGCRTIPWKDIRDVERRPPRFRKSSGTMQIPAFQPEVRAAPMNDGCGLTLSWVLLWLALAFFTAMAIAAAALFAFWVLFLVFLPLVVLPALEVFGPFGDRIRIRSRDRLLVLRDLRDADEFMSQVAAHRPVTG